MFAEEFIFLPHEREVVGHCRVHVCFIKLVFRADRIARSLLCHRSDDLVSNFYGRNLLYFHFITRLFDLLLEFLKLLLDLIPDSPQVHEIPFEFGKRAINSSRPDNCRSVFTT